jgi:mono/diheme cytochrome c family protein
MSTTNASTGITAALRASDWSMPKNSETQQTPFARATRVTPPLERKVELRTLRMGGVTMALVLLCGGCSSKPVPMAGSGPQAGADLKNPTDLNSSSIQQGEVLYHAADCALCHGKKGDGKGFDAKNGHMNVHDWRNAEYSKSFTDGQLYDVIARGKDTMPAYGTLNAPNQIWLMVDYIRSLSMK